MPSPVPTFITEAHTSAITTIVTPPGLTPGDVMIAAIVQRTARTVASVTPGTWVMIADVLGGASTVSCAVMWKVYEAGDPSTFHVSNTAAGTTSCRSSTFGFSGVSHVDADDTVSTRAGLGTPILWDSITVDAASPLVVGFCAGLWPSTWDPDTHISPAVDSRWHGMGLVSGDVAGYGFTDAVPPGASGGYAFTLNAPHTTDGWASVLLTLRPGTPPGWPPLNGPLYPGTQATWRS